MSWSAATAKTTQSYFDLLKFNLMVVMVSWYSTKDAGAVYIKGCSLALGKGVLVDQAKDIISISSILYLLYIFPFQYQILSK